MLAQQYASHLSGNLEGRICVLSEEQCSPLVEDALVKSLQALKVNTEELLYVTIDSLTHQDIVRICEMFDPRIIIASNAYASALLLDSYSAYSRKPHLASTEQTIAKGTLITVFSRCCLVFSNLEELLGTQEGKRQAWMLLKQLKAFL